MATIKRETGAYVLQPGAGRTIPVPSAKGRLTMKAEKHQTGVAPDRWRVYGLALA